MLPSMKTFRDALLLKLEETGLSMRELSARAEVSYDQIKKLRLREGASTNVEDAIKIARFFGYTVEEFMGASSDESRKLAQIYGSLTDRERKILRLVGQSEAFRSAGGGVTSG